MAGVQFYEGWAKYGNAGDYAVYTAATYAVGNLIQANGWTLNPGSSVYLVTGPTPSSLALRVDGASSGTSISAARRSFTNAATFTLGFFFRVDTSPAGDRAIVLFEDSTSDQCCLSISATNVLTARSGGASGTVLGTAASALSSGVWYFIEVTTTINNTTGAMDVDINGANVISVSSVNTRGGSANNYANVFNFLGGGGAGIFSWGPLYFRDDSTRMGEVTVETLEVTTDEAVDFAFGAMTMGPAYRYGAINTNNAPGANQIVLRKYTCPASGSFASVNILPGATSAGAKFKAVIYSDSSGPSGAPLDTGTEVVGCTSGTMLSLPATTPPSVTAGTDYWIGYITDTSVTIQIGSTDTVGYKAANTYASGAPSSPSMTSGQSSWLMYGTITGVTTNAPEVSVLAPGGDLNYVYSSTVNHEDLFDIASLSDTPITIYEAQVWAYTAKSDAGARTFDLRLKSNATTSSGSSSGQSQSVSYAWQGSRFTTDPNTGTTWTAFGINSAKIGYMIAS